MSRIGIGGRGGRLTINLLEYERIADAYYSDANWLSGKLDIDIVPFRGRMGITFTTHGFVRLLKDLEQASSNSTGEVSLESEAGNLMLVFSFKPEGFVSIEGSIRSETANHSVLTFVIDSDLWFTKETIDDLELATQAYPVRGQPD